MKRYLFTIGIVGLGNSQEEAWKDAVAAFLESPGPPPDDPNYIQGIDDEE